MAKARTASQKAAARRNLEKARRAKKKGTAIHVASAIHSAKNSKVGAGKGYFSAGGAASHINAVKRLAGVKVKERLSYSTSSSAGRGPIRMHMK